MKKMFKLNSKHDVILYDDVYAVNCYNIFY